jgi:flagellin-like hook-associated protein FlgL
MAQGQINSQDALKDVKIHNEGNVDRNYIVNEATALYKECLKIAKEAGVDTEKIISGKGTPKKQDLEFLDKLFYEKRSQHKQLSDTYPTVVRHMIQELQYSRVAFDDYLKGLEKNPWMNDQQRMDSYADYGVLLYRRANKKSHPSKTQIELFRKDYRERLQDEHDKFMESVKEHQKQIDKESQKYTNGAKKDLIALLKKQIENDDAATKKRMEENMIAGKLFEGGADAVETANREQIEKLVKAGILSEDALKELDQ